MGELLRRKAADNAYDPEWLQAIEAMDKGEPVSNELCKQLLEEAIQAQPSQWGYVIEGFPRDIDQAEDFEQVSYLRILKFWSFDLKIFCMQTFILLINLILEPSRRFCFADWLHGAILHW